MFIKNIIATSAIVLGIIGCTSCSTKTPEPVTPVEPSPTSAPEPPKQLDTVVSQDNWQFTLPGQNWVKLFQCDAGDITCPHVFLKQDEKLSVIFAVAPFSGTMDEYVLSVVRGVKSGGGTVLSLKQVELGSKKFVLVDTLKETAKVWIWNTVLEEKAYSMYCGGKSQSVDMKELCSKVSTTLIIN